MKIQISKELYDRDMKKACHSSEKIYVEYLSKKVKDLLDIIEKLKQEKCSIARNSCPECNKQKSSLSIFGFGRNKRTASESRNQDDAELHKEIEDLRKEKERLISDLDLHKTESRREIDAKIKENDRLLQDLDIKTKANEEILDMIGNRRKEFDQSNEELIALKGKINNMQIEIELQQESTQEKNIQDNKILNEKYEKIVVERRNLLQEFEQKNRELEEVKRALENVKKEQEEVFKESENISKQIETIDYLNRDNEQLKVLHKEVVHKKDELLRENLRFKEINHEYQNEKEKLLEDLKLHREKNNELADSLKMQEKKYDRDISEANQKLIQKLEETEYEIEHLKYDRNKTAEEKDELARNLKLLEQRINDTSEQKDALDRQLISKIEELNNVTNDKDRIKTEMNRVIEETKQNLESSLLKLEIKDTELCKLKEDMKHLQEELKRLKQQEKEHLKCENMMQSFKSELHDMTNSKLELEVNCGMLASKNTHMKEELIRLKEENNLLSKNSIVNVHKLEKSLAEINHLKKEKMQLEEDNGICHRNILDLQRDSETLVSELEMSRKECKELMLQLEKLSVKPRKCIELHVFSSMKQKLTEIAMNDLNGQLKQRLGNDETDVVLCPAVMSSNVKGPSVVLCISLSRLGADVQEALKGITVSADVAIIIFHHKEAHALPSQSSEKILTGADYKQLGCIIDMAILSNKGIYNCGMNDVGIEKLVSFLKRF